jgi:putative ABC transport system permease protein
MWRWAYRSFVDDRASLAASAGGVAVMFLLVMILEGAFQGEADQTVAFIEHGAAPIWVMQDGVNNVHMASSALGEDVMAKVRAVPGVGFAEGILYGAAVARLGAEEPIVYLAGLRDDQRAGPWDVAAGHARPARGEVVLPEVLARRGHVELGAMVQIHHRPFRLVGLSRGTYSMANSLGFLHAADLAALFDMIADANYLLVWPATGLSAGTLVARIRAAVPEVSALQRPELAANDRALALQMGAELIAIMTFVAALVAAMIIGFTVFTFAARRTRELAVAKAVGARRGQLLGAAVGQAIGLTLLGYVLALGLAAALQPIFNAWAPGIIIHFSLSGMARVGLTALAVAALAGVLPAWRVARVDPTVVFSS